YQNLGPFSASGQLSVNTSSVAQATVLYQQTGGNFTIQSLSAGSDYENIPPWPAAGTPGTITLASYQGVSFSGTVPSTATDGQFALVTMTISGTFAGGYWAQCSLTFKVVVINPCSQKVTEWNGTLLTAT